MIFNNIDNIDNLDNSYNNIDNYGFIITRHVNSEITNKYWNKCIQHIRINYPNKKIVVIDDNSKKEFLNSEYEYINVEYINSEFIGRGELLPYYYLCKNHFFDNAVIIHDSVFIQKRINIEYLLKKQIKVLPLWHFTHEKRENLNNTKLLIDKLSNNYNIMNIFLQDKQYEKLGKNREVWSGCFGVQSIINRNFLIEISNKYKLFNLLNYVKKRSDRCCLERIMGVIFFIEYLKNINTYSLLGDISNYCKWGYTYNEYCSDMVNNKKMLHVIKVWSGR